MTFNRTIVELKQSREMQNLLHELAFNRTIVELKRERKETMNNEFKTFNRTIVELKRCLVVLSKLAGLFF